MSWTHCTDCRAAALSQVFKAHYHTILRLKQFFPFSLIDAMGSLEECKSQVLRELRYQSSLDLDEATYAAIRCGERPGAADPAAILDSIEAGLAASSRPSTGAKRSTRQGLLSVHGILHVSAGDCVVNVRSRLSGGLLYVNCNVLP